MQESYQIYPIGVVHKDDRSIAIEIYDKFTDALLGLESFSHISVFYWFHQNDTPENRKILRVHPRGDKRNPLTGVFATHSPVRPNLIATTLCKIESIESNRIRIDEIDAHDGSPVIDIKCFIPTKRSLSDLKQPDWL
jgi:tRNA-Thr(GGU) m(6)t(6)A37 methyltransferase TsaA